ncbi:MAG TPA: hypothetical protein ENF21_00455 [Bacteroidetes bacterium]|nr:hypothetical protein [Bacteroidota bacterium]
MKRFVAVFFVSVLFLSSCEKEALIFTGRVTASIQGDDLKISNGTKSRIYFMVMEASCADIWPWQPMTDGPNFIEGGRYRLRPLSGIPCCSTRSSVTEGDEILVYWWKDDWDDSQELNRIRVVVK